jgi:acyl-CoA dehydrogenase
MNAGRIMTLQEADEDRRVARSAMRGILIAASNLHAAGSADLMTRAGKVAVVAVTHAAAVDAQSRFPKEAIDAARAERLLSAAVPPDLGGEGASTADIVDVCYMLGRNCASTAMIYAMHQTKVACLVRHGRGSAWHQRLLRRLCAEQLLLASSTTEGRAGGDVRNSSAPIEWRDSRIVLERQATVISYAEAADGIVTTARRSPEAPSSDQVLVAFLKDDYALKRLNGWDAFGMRGTCSEGFALSACGSAEQILPVSYDKIHAQTMMPFAHLAWSGAWAGIAAAAIDRARAFVRKATHGAGGTMPPGAQHLTRANATLRTLRSLIAAAAIDRARAFVRKATHGAGGTMPPGAQHLTRANATLRTLRSLIAAALQRFEAAASDPALLESIDFQTGMNMLKVNASELAVATVMSAMQACGLAGYRNDSEFSVGRHLRDILSSPVMISNDRILANIGAASLLSSTPASLRD